MLVSFQTFKCSILAQTLYIREYMQVAHVLVYDMMNLWIQAAGMWKSCRVSIFFFLYITFVSFKRFFL